MAQCIKYADIGLQPWKNRGERNSRQKGLETAVESGWSTLEEFSRECWQGQENWETGLQRSISIITTGPLRGEGRPKSLRTPNSAIGNLQLVRLFWTSRCACMQAAPLDSLRGPFLKIEELNLWYNFRSKNNTKHVFTRDCQCRVVLSLEVPMAILMTGKI